MKKTLCPTLLATLAVTAAIVVSPARAEIYLYTDVQLDNIQWTPESGTLNWLSDWELEAAASVFDSQSGFDSDYQYQFGQPAVVVANASTPLITASSQAEVDAAGNIVSLQSSLSQFNAPAGALSGFSGATIHRDFTITGGSGSVPVLFSLDYSGIYQSSSGAAADYLVSLRISDGVNQWNLTAANVLGGASGGNGINTLFAAADGLGELSGDGFSGSLSDWWIFEYDVAYSFDITTESETPEASPLLLLALGGVLLFGWSKVLRKKVVRSTFLVSALLAFNPLSSLANLHIEGGCYCCEICETCWCCPDFTCGSRINILQGSMEDDYQVFSSRNSRPGSLHLDLAYSSRQANGEFLSADNTSLGFGWAHSYGTFLFRQQGVLYRRDGAGRILKFNRQLGTNPVLYKPTDGWFETMVANPDGSFTINYPDGTVEQFTNFPACPYFFKSPIYQMIRRTDRNGNTTALDYDSLGRLATVTDAYGRTLEFDYDTNHRIATITGPLGRVTRFEYSPFGAALLKITDPAGNAVRYEYDGQYRVSRKTHKNGHVFLYTCGQGSLTAEYLRPNGTRMFLGSVSNTSNWAVNTTLLEQQLKTEYIPSTVTRLDARSNLWVYMYNKNAYATNVIAPGPTSNHQLAFDPVTRRTLSDTDANGNTTFYGYDERGNRTAITNALGQVTRYTYEPVFNRVTSITDPNGFVTTNLYDGYGNLIQETDPLGYTREWTYDSHGNVLSEKDKNGNITQYFYDEFGNRTNTTDALGNVTIYTYDAVGNLLSRTDANFHTSTYTYDALNRLIAETNGLSGPPPGPLMLPTSVSLNIETLTNGDLLLSWEGSGFKLTRASSPVGPYEDVLIEGELVTNGPVVVVQPANDLQEFYRLKSIVPPLLTGGSKSSMEKQYDGFSSGETAHYTYDAEGNRTSVTDANGNITYYAYDEKDRLIFSTNALGYVTAITYDAAGNKISQTDANGHTTWYAYDAQNRLAHVTNALDYVTSYSYDPVGNKISETDANGHTTLFGYDALNRLIATTNALGYVTQYEYDAGPGGGGSCGCGAGTAGTSLITKQTDANTKVTYFKYCPLGRLLKIIHKQGDTADLIDDDDAVTACTYDPNGNRLSTAVRIAVTEYITNWFGYDALNRQIAATNGAGEMILTAYDPVGNVFIVTTPNGNLTTNTCDNLNRLVEVDDKIGLRASYTYDCIGNRLSATDGNGNTITYTYDALNRLVTTTDAMSQTTHIFYDPVGNLTNMVDRMTNATVYLYDALNRRTSTVDAIGCQTSYAYNGVGNLLSITDANSHTTSYEYDALNRLVTEIYPDLPGPSEPTNSNKRFFTYDGVGKLTSRTDQTGNTTLYQYNDLNYLTNRSYPSDPSDRFTYDLAGRMLTASKTNWLTTNDWVVTFTYDGANRVTNTTQGGRVIAYAYNIPARTRTLTYPSGTNITETTDFRGRLLAVNDGGVTPIATYTYDLGNRVLTRTYRNGVVAEYAYNPNDWITSLIHTNSAATNLIAGFTYDYDLEGNKYYEENLWNTNRSEAYAYDPIHRLTNWLAGNLVNGTVPSPTNTQSWQLDCLGNWNAMITNGITQTRTHNDANEITSIDTNSVYHDHNGNLTNDSRYAYAYDNENRLVTATRLFLIPGDTSPRLVGQYAYDALGRRIAKLADPDPTNAPSSTVYLHDSARVIEEQTLTAITLATYIYGNYIDEVLTMDRAGQMYYYQQSSLFSVAAVTDSTASLVEGYGYEAYGFPTITDGANIPIADNAWGTPHSAIGNSYLFTGRRLDEEAGFYFYRARYYDGERGSFLQRDPLINALVRSQLVYRDAPLRRNQSLRFSSLIVRGNFYAYAEGNPLNSIDPYGLKHRNADEAARAAIDAIKPKSIAKNIEHCGILCKHTRTKEIKSVGPVKGTVDGCDPGKVKCPNEDKCWVLIAYWHTHGDFVDKDGDGRDDYDSENFSGADKRYANHHKIDGYVGTPSCSTKKYDHRGKRVTVIKAGRPFTIVVRGPDAPGFVQYARAYRRTRDQAEQFAAWARMQGPYQVAIITP